MSEISAKVEDTVEKFKNKGERVEIYKTPINYDDVVYHYAVYRKNNQVIGQIIVTTDGKVPLLDQIKEVLWMVVGVNSTVSSFWGEFREWAQTPTELLRRQLWVLNSVEKSFDMSDDIQKSFAQFKNVPSTLLEEQIKMVQAVKEGVEYNNAMQEITVETAKRMTEYWKKIMGSKYKQHVSMVDTYDDRKKVLNYVKDQVTIFKPKKWMLYSDLKAQHRSFSLSPADLKAHKDVKDDIYGEAASKAVFKGTMERNRNPKV
ncbi:MAG: hypothetical protein N2B06_06040 [Clostridium sp.]